MVQIWYMEPYPCGDPRLPHHLFPPKKITPDELVKKSGVQCWQVDVNDLIATSKRILLTKSQKGYNSEDIWTIDEVNTIDFADKLEELFEDKEAEEDQARLIIEGSAYYDIEDYNGNWIRILCEYGDLIVIPAGKCHRFTTTPKNYVKMRRFFKR